MPRGVYQRTEEVKKIIGESVKTRWQNPKSRKTAKEKLLSFGMATRFKKGQKPWNKGLVGINLGESANNWKGDNVGYSGIHRWVLKELGHPNECKNCGKLGRYLFRRNGVRYWNIHWHNKSGRYYRKLSDWIPFCLSCHNKFHALMGKSNDLL